MARAVYQAPGVYVEEVPSAQQPIAGVGTNTVGFIGVVDDVIYYPVPNPHYNPVIAQSVLRLVALRAKAGEGSEAEKKRIASEITSIEEARRRNLAVAEKLVTELEGQIPALEADRKNKATALTQATDERDKFPELTEQEKEDKQKKKEHREREGELNAKVGTAESELKKAEQKLSDTNDLLEQEKAHSEQLRAKLEQPKAAPPSPDQGSGTGPDESVLMRKSIFRPYLLQRFDVKAAPFDTRLCTNFSEYTDRFGPFSADEIDGTPDPDDPKKRIFKPLHPGHRALTHAVNGFFKNGGTRCFVARVKPDQTGNVNAKDIEQALAALESVDAVAIVAAPGLDDPDIWNELVAHCEKCEDRFAILDCPATVGTDTELNIRLLQYDNLGNVLPQRNKNAAFYFPYIEVVDPAKQLQDADPARGVDRKYAGRTYVAPSGHIAGIYARTDEERGVHKAPANAAVLGALNVKYYVGKPKQELLNPQGVNCIRNINGNITVWGARTIGGDANGEWKYVSVRRFFLFLRESIDEGTQWCVFEPNDPTLWGKIRRNVSAFLTNVWRSGALFGLTPEEAFYVKCDAETNPPEVRDLGMVVTEIGVAIVRPAEFVIFRITQATGPRTS